MISCVGSPIQIICGFFIDYFLVSVEGESSHVRASQVGPSQTGSSPGRFGFSV